MFSRRVALRRSFSSAAKLVVGPRHRRMREELNQHMKIPNVASENAFRTFALETYGCQMNVNDTDLVRSLLLNAGYEETKNADEATVLLINTCAVREKPEEKVKHKLLRHRKLVANDPERKVAVLGCMAERLKHELIEDKLADIVVGPDAYRALPSLISLALYTNQSQIDVQLSAFETYEDLLPVRDEFRINAFVSIMRGCNNMCSFCVVPFTRGRERSRPYASILKEIQRLQREGVKEVTLLGQNVNSYNDLSEGSERIEAEITPGFSNLYKRRSTGRTFACLLRDLATEFPALRFRFVSPHPKDFPRELIDVIADTPNVCKNLHLPAQSGNNEILKSMRRGYTRESYLELVKSVRDKIPQVTLSTDLIVGFCGESEAQFQDTLSLMEQVKFNNSFNFAYSMREKTHAHRKMVDDVPADVKKRRLNELIDLFKRIERENNLKQIGSVHEVLVEGEARKGKDLVGRTTGNQKIVFDGKGKVSAGDYVDVIVTDVVQTSLLGDLVK